MFDGKQYKKEADWLFNNIVAYAEFPPIVPSIMAKAYTQEKEKQQEVLWWLPIKTKI
jgi:hypothetical protein